MVRWPAFVALLAVAGLAAFAVGRWTAPHPSPAPAAAPPTAEPATTPSVASTPDPAARPRLTPPARAARPATPPFTPPPVPNDPLVTELVARPDGEPTDAMIHGRDASTNQWIDGVFGADFDPAKRAAILAAQQDAARRSGEMMWDYYHGYIDQDGSATALHQIFLIYAQALQAALTPDEYRALMHLEPGMDTYTAITMPGTRPGDVFVDAGATP